jgi:hypothetical protein
MMDHTGTTSPSSLFKNIVTASRGSQTPGTISFLSSLIISEVPTTPTDNLNDCTEEPKIQEDNGNMNTSGISRRSRVLPQQCSDSAVVDRQPDQECSKKRAHSVGYLWLHRQHALLNPRWRLFSMACIAGILCMIYTLPRISDYHYPKKNLLIGYYPRSVYMVGNHSAFGEGSLLPEPKMEVYLYPSERVIFEPMSKAKTQLHIEDSKDYKKGKLLEFETDDCKAQYEWQKTSYPTCNTVYEFDLTQIFDSETGDPRAKLLANGFWRDVWGIREESSNTRRVLKTMRYKHPYSKIPTLRTHSSKCKSHTHTTFVLLFEIKLNEISIGTEEMLWQWSA